MDKIDKMQKNKPPLVSIITPSYNQGKYIEETILSVIRQDYGNIEYIIIDGGSNDNTIEVIQKYQKHISYWESNKDDGQTHAIIKGFEKAKGKYITWLCSDDILETSMVSLSVTFLETYPDIVMTYGNRTRIDSKSNIIAVQKCSQFRPWFLKWGFAIPQETCMIRREAYDHCGGLNVYLQMAMDFDLFCKLNKIGKIIHLPFFLGRFRSHHINKSTIFSKQVGESGFNQGAPLELAKVYFEHFKRKFPTKKWKYISLVEFLLLQIDKRTSKYKDMLSLKR